MQTDNDLDKKTERDMQRQTDKEIEQQTDKDMKRIRQAKWLEADSHWYGEADRQRFG
jgi:hypothetical protein